MKINPRNKVQGPFVEFFNPKMRRELEKKDEDIKRTTGLKGSAPGGDDWTYLSGNTRVPVSFMKTKSQSAEIKQTKNKSQFLNCFQ